MKAIIVRRRLESSSTTTTRAADDLDTAAAAPGVPGSADSLEGFAAISIIKGYLIRSVQTRHRIFGGMGGIHPHASFAVVPIERKLQLHGGAATRLRLQFGVPTDFTEAQPHILQSRAAGPNLFGFKAFAVVGDGDAAG